MPSPNVAEDHQTKNALSLSDKDAAVLVKDVEAKDKLIPEALSILGDANRLKTLTAKIEGMEKHNAAAEIVDEIYKQAYQ